VSVEDGFSLLASVAKVPTSYGGDIAPRGGYCWRMKATISALLLDSAMHSNQKTQRPTQHEFINQLEHGTERVA
jgi:hypothetical protein